MRAIRTELRFTSALLFVVLLAALGLEQCAHIRHPSGKDINPRAPSAWEQVLVWNAALAESNRGVAEAVIAGNQAGEISIALSKRILDEQEKIAKADEELTKILQRAQSTVLGSDPGQIKALIEQIRTSTQEIIASGVAGIKNAAKQHSVQAAAETILTLAGQILEGLHGLGIVQLEPARVEDAERGGRQ